MPASWSPCPRRRPSSCTVRPRTTSWARPDALTKDSAFRDLDVFKVVREGRTLYLLAHLALASYQRRIGASLGVKPGAELLAAVRAARARDIPVELIDR